jgi:DNA-binding NtrC family response regulator
MLASRPLAPTSRPPRGRARSEPRTGDPQPGTAIGRSVWVLDDEPGMRSFLQRGLARHAVLVEAATTTDQGRALLRRCRFGLIIADIRLPGTSSIVWVEELREQCNPVEAIFIADTADLATAIAALRAGAADFIIKPFRIEQLLAAVERCFAHGALARENDLLHRESDQRHSLDGIVGRYDPMKQICAIINRVAAMPATVLIQGESGTGKELAARAIHARSGRPGNSVALN